MGSACRGPVTAVEVGNLFVEKYYPVLKEQPHFVHQFYTDVSTMARIDGPVIDVATGTLQIHSLIMSMNFIGIEIKAAHSLDSCNGSVLVMVSGVVQIKRYGGRRLFAQSFFLAPQEKGYFILNDIFHCLDEKQLPNQPAAFQRNRIYDSESNMSYSQLELVMENMLGQGSQGGNLTPAMHANLHEAFHKYSAELGQLTFGSDKMAEAQVENPLASHPNMMGMVQDLSPQPAKHTYASILQTHSTSSTSQSSLIKSTPVVSEWHTPQYTSVATSSSKPDTILQNSLSEAVQEITLGNEGEVKSVYVRNLPTSASVSDLELEFQNFGRIKPGGVDIKSRKEAGVFYAFVEFEDITGVHNALLASPIWFKGQDIHVHERRPNSGSSRGGGRGNNGYKYEGSRRRFCGPGFGRAKMQENRDKDYDNRQRGNGFHRRGS